MISVRSKSVAATIALAAVAVACSGSESSEESLPPETVASTEAPTTTTTTTTTTTVPETTTTEPAPTIETVPDESDSVPQSSAPESVPDPDVPTNTMFDPTTLEGEIEQVVLNDIEAYRQCLRDLPDCDVDQAVRFADAEYREGRRESLQASVSAGAVAENVESIELEVTEIRIGDTGAEAEVEFCIVDDSRIFVPDGDGGVVESIWEGNASVRRQTLVANFDPWKMIGVGTLEFGDLGGNNLCA